MQALCRNAHALYESGRNRSPLTIPDVTAFTLARSSPFTNARSLLSSMVTSKTIISPEWNREEAATRILELQRRVQKLRAGSAKTPEEIAQVAPIGDVFKSCAISGNEVK